MKIQSYSAGCSLNGSSGSTDASGQSWLCLEREVNKGSVRCRDSLWSIQVLARESYSKQRLYIKQKFLRPNRTYTKLDLFQSRHILRYHCKCLIPTRLKNRNSYYNTTTVNYSSKKTNISLHFHFHCNKVKHIAQGQQGEKIHSCREELYWDILPAGQASLMNMRGWTASIFI